MIPSKFKEATASLSRPMSMSEEECGSLYVYQDEQSRYTVSMWRPSLRERLSLLLFGRVWVYVYSGGTTQPPIALSVARSVFDKEVK